MEEHKQKSYYVGTQLKMQLDIEADGFNQDTDPWQVTLRCGANQVVCSKTDNTITGVVNDDAQWYLLIDTQSLGVGPVTMITEIMIPDGDFDSGFRKEIYKDELMIIKRI